MNTNQTSSEKIYIITINRKFIFYFLNCGLIRGSLSKKKYDMTIKFYFIYSKVLKMEERHSIQKREPALKSQIKSFKATKPTHISNPN